MRSDLGKEVLRRAFLGEQASFGSSWKQSPIMPIIQGFVSAPSGVVYEGDVVSKATTGHVPSDSNHRVQASIDNREMAQALTVAVHRCLSRKTKHSESYGRKMGQKHEREKIASSRPHR
jgi:hypothetical protein